MSRIDISKLTGWGYLAPPVDTVTVSKLIAYAWIMPGDSGPDTSNRQGHCYVQIVEN